MVTMKIGKNYVDFFNGNHSFYELSLIGVRADNLEMQIEHMEQKRWFTPQISVDFRQALTRWVNFGNALKEVAARKTSFAPTVASTKTLN